MIVITKPLCRTVKMYQNTPREHLIIPYNDKAPPHNSHRSKQQKFPLIT